MILYKEKEKKNKNLTTTDEYGETQMKREDSIVFWL
jgi:hypothetical protein